MSLNKNNSTPVHRPFVWALKSVFVAAAVLCFMAPRVAADLPSYTEPIQKPPPVCEADTPASLAIRDCSKLLRSEDTDPQQRVQVYTHRGYAWLKEEEPLAAISDFTRAIELDPSHENALKGRARSHENLEKYVEAIEDWTRLIDLNKTDPDVYLQRGKIYHLAGKHELAVADFSHVLELDKKNLEGLVGRAVAFESLERFESALSDFATAITIDDKFIPAFVARGEFWQRRGDTKKAIADYQRALELNSINLKVRQALKKLGVFWIYP